MSIQYITRKGSFDSSHRILNESMKCFNLHGHTYLYELTYKFNSSADIGYPIDFKEIKRVACEWIDRYMDHCHMSNPKDTVMINVVKKLKNKLWVMSLNGDDYCNPSVENIAKELFVVQCLIAKSWGNNIVLDNIKLYETPNCCTTCTSLSFDGDEMFRVSSRRGDEVRAFIKEMGTVEYDDRLQARKSK